MKNIPDDIYKATNEMLHDSLRVPIGVDDKLLDQYLKASVSYVLAYTGAAPSVLCLVYGLYAGIGPAESDLVHVPKA